nr:hypothetical protein [Mimivirus sp.]
MFGEKNYEIGKKLDVCQCENTKLKCELKNRDKKICELCETNKKLICQINYVCSENADLNHKLRKTLSSLKCLSNKYKSLKKNAKSNVAINTIDVIHVIKTNAIVVMEIMTIAIVNNIQIQHHILNYHYY